MPTSTRTTRLGCEALEARDLPSALYAAARVESPTAVRVALVDDATQTASGVLLTVTGSAAGVSVASGDINADGTPDVAVSAENARFRGGLAVQTYKVVVLDGASLRAGRVVVLAQHSPYESAVTGRVNLAMGDLDGNGRAELVTGAQGTGYGPRVKVYRYSSYQGILQSTETSNFFSQDAGQATLGVDVAVGDATGDGRPDIVTLTEVVEPGTNGQPSFNRRANVYASNGGLPYIPAVTTTRLLRDTFLTATNRPPALAVGDVTGDGRAEILVGVVFTFDDGATWQQAVTAHSASRVDPLTGFAAVEKKASLNTAGSAPVRLLARDLTGDGRADLRIGSQPQAADRVDRMPDFMSSQFPTPAGSLNPFASDFRGGVEVG